MKGVHPPLADQASTVRADVVEVGPQFNPPSERDVPSNKGRWNWLRLAGLVTLLLVGIGLMPGAQRSSPSTTVNLTLPQPVVATSTIPVAPRAVAVVTEETFSLIPVTDLDGYDYLAGPVEFAGRHWVAAGTAASNDAVILSSTNGANWVTESEIVGPEPSLIVQKLVVFRSNLVVVASLSGVATTSMSPAEHSQRLVTWATTDGRKWSFQALPDLEGAAYYDVRAAAGNDRLIISAGTFEAYGELMEPRIPAEFRPAMAAGQLFANWERRSDLLTIRLMAPPGLEVFSTAIEVTSRVRRFYDSRVLFSEDLISWHELDPSIAGTWGLAWSEDLGFIRRGLDGATLISTDGQFWERSTELPPADFRTWRDGLLGLVDTTGGTVDLLVVDHQIETRIGLPSDMFVANGYPWIETGPGGLIAAVTRYEMQPYQSATVSSGGFLLTLENTPSASPYALVIKKNGQDHARILLGTPSAKATYDPVTGWIEIPPGEGVELTTIPLEDLAAFWKPPPNSARTEFYQSPDGLIWSKGEAAIFSDGVTLIGGTDDGFLIGIGAHGIAGWEGDMTVLRTGPMD